MSWSQFGQDLLGLLPNDASGASVALSSDGLIVAIGDIFHDPTIAGTLATDAGRVRVYKYNLTNSMYEKYGQDIIGRAAGDWAGFVVALSSDGKIVAIGAPYANVTNSGNPTAIDTGHVLVYKYHDIDTTWKQLGPDINTSAIGLTTNDKFGYSVSLSDDGKIVAVGVPNRDPQLLDAGGVFVYRYNETLNTWPQLGTIIKGEAADDGYGYSVSLSSDGKVLAIGAPKNDSLIDNITQSNTGHVRVFKYNETLTTPNWTKIGQDIDGEATLDGSGSWVSLSSDGTIVAISAPQNNPTLALVDAGQVRIYKYNSATNLWNQIGQDIDGVAAGDQAGSYQSVSLNALGNIVAIGAVFNDTTSSNSGHVRIYMYDSANNLWNKIGADINAETLATKQSGYSVSLSDSGFMVAVGAPFNAPGDSYVGSNAGRVRVYEYVSPTTTTTTTEAPTTTTEAPTTTTEAPTTTTEAPTHQTILSLESVGTSINETGKIKYVWQLTANTAKL